MRKGRYLVRVAAGGDDLARAHALRARCFGTSDQDGFDAGCTHVLVLDAESNTLVCCFRVLSMPAADIPRSYSAQFYDLTRLTRYAGPLMELGRFCIHPDHPDPDILRIAWAWLTDSVDREGITLLFGCASFVGGVAAPHLDAFDVLRAKHQAPPEWQPAVKASDVFDFSSGLARHRVDLARAQATMPPMLRSYLAMGGWVSDHAVFDHDLCTMHVFTAVEIAAIPPARARLLRDLAKAARENG